MLILFKLIGALPFWLLYPIGWILSIPTRLIYRRKVVFNNLRKAFPDKDVAEIRQIQKQFYRNFMDIVVETVKTPSISEKEFNRRVKLINAEVLEKEFQNDRSVLIFASHFCNWEWVSHAISLRTSYKLDPIYKVQANKVLDQFIYKVRTRFGGSPIPKESSVRNIIKNKGNKRAIGFVADQRPFTNGSKVWINFLSIETAFFPGCVAMPYITQFPCYYMKVVRVKRGFYEVEAINIGQPRFEKNDSSIIKKYASEIEKQIENHPADWLWSHKRWKYQRSNEEELLS